MEGTLPDARPQVALVGALAIGAASLTLVLPDAAFEPGRVAAYAAGYGLVFLAAERMGFLLHWRGHSTRISLEEFTLVGGLLVLPAPVLVGATAVAVAASQLAERRPLLKATFNVSQYALSAAVAAVAFQILVAAGVAPLWAAIPAPFLFAFVSQLATAAVFARLEGQRLARVFRTRFLHWALVASVIGVSLGLGAYALWRLHPVLLLAIAPVFLLLARFGRLTEWAEEEVRVHKALAETTTRAAATGDFDAVADGILETCGDIFGAGEAALTLALRPDEPRTWSWTHPQGAGPHGLRVVVPTPVGAPGELVVYPRTGRPAYGERDRHLLAIVAASAASAAAGTTALQDLKEANLRLKNANRELEEFTLWTTHDMREPLRSVGQLARILRDDIGDIGEDEARDLAERIARGADSLKDRIKALHEFSRVVQEDVPFETVDLGDLLDEAQEGLAAKVEERGARVLRDGELPVVRAQRARLAKVLANLVENALKYNDKAAPVVEVACADLGDEWEVRVRDNGPGIPAAFRERVFMLFQRGPGAKDAGSGAGLAIVKRIVEQHGGLVWIQEAAGGGADFRFTLPKQRDLVKQAARLAPARAPSSLVTVRR